MFELREKTKARLDDLIVLSAKNRKDADRPGAKFVLELKLPNHLLAYFDGRLKGVMYERAQGAPTNGHLDGIDPVSDMPSLSNIASKIGSVKWHHESSGYSLSVDYGAGGKRNIEIDDCKLSNWKFTFHEGGTFTAKFDVESENVTEAQFGKMAMYKSRDIEILLTPPDENAQGEIGDD